MTYNRLSKLASAVRTALPAYAETLEERRLFAASFDLGMNINVGTSDVRDKGIPVMKQLGVKSVRVWFGPDFSQRSWEGPLQRSVDYAAAGFDVMLIINPQGGKLTNPTEVKNWFNWALGNKSLREAVDRWQIGNEIDSTHYWKGSFKQYVSNFLKPASEALRAHGESVVSASVSWNPEDVRELISEGILQYSDYVGYHPYASSIAQLKSRVDAIQSIVAGRKPIIASEWNVRNYEGNKTKWASMVKEAFPIIRDGFAINYYFALLNTTATRAGPAGIMNSDGSKQTGFYNALAAGMTNTPPASDDEGNTPSTIPSIAKISVFLESTGEKIIDSLQSGAVIDLSGYDSNELRFVATVGSGVSSVHIELNSGSIIENNEPYEWMNYSAYAGSYTISATGYSKDNLKGTEGKTRTFTFTVTGSPRSTTGGTSGIRGTLWNDTDADGRYDSGEGRTGVRLVYLDDNRNGRLDDGERTTWSNADGDYSFTGLKPGTYYVARAFPRGYKLSNNDLGYITVNLGSSKTVSGVNLGSTYA
jgi:hypothetical protein